MLYLETAAATHTGMVRSNNEDNFYLQRMYRQELICGEERRQWQGSARRFLAAVADGMGGCENGEIAALLAVQALTPCPISAGKSRLSDHVTAANEAICRKIQSTGGGRMGATLTALLIDGGKALCANLGDSRCYLMRSGILEQLSVDHTRAEQMVRLGVLTPEQAAAHPGRHELTLHLGIFPEELVVQAEFREVELCAGDVFLLCSDGLTDMVTEQSIRQCLAQETGAEEQAQALIQMALERGGRDNVTVVVIRVGKRESFLYRIFPKGIQKR